jgi:hypothetical protein
MGKRRKHGGFRGPMPVDVQLRAQVVSLRRAGMLVNDICQRLDLHKSSERMAVEMICDALPRRFQVGIESGPHNSRHRIRTGNWA